LGKAEGEGLISGVPIAARGYKLSHLLFADDTLLFCRANAVEWDNEMSLLKKYEKVSGQKLNSQKTSIFYGWNTGANFKEFITASAGLQASSNLDKYLGLQALIGRSKTPSFADMRGRVHKRLKGWKEKFLSQAGREILIKAVVQAIPTYSMSIFKLPKALCRSLNSMMNRFWWGRKQDERGTCWKSWTILGVAKKKGGMGFRDLETFNLALLAKQGWRLIQQPGSLLSRIMCEKYYPNSSFMHALLGHNPSYAWRSFVASKDILKKGLQWRIGNGISTKIWGDQWLPILGKRLNYNPAKGLDPDTRVCSLIDRQSGGWNYPLLQALFSKEEADLIGGIALSPLNQPDRLIWGDTKNRFFFL
jgi:hypothetical protein